MLYVTVDGPKFVIVTHRRNQLSKGHTFQHLRSRFSNLENPGKAEYVYIQVSSTVILQL